MFNSSIDSRISVKARCISRFLKSAQELSSLSHSDASLSDDESDKYYENEGNISNSEEDIFELEIVNEAPT